MPRWSDPRDDDRGRHEEEGEHPLHDEQDELIPRENPHDGEAVVLARARQALPHAVGRADPHQSGQALDGFEELGGQTGPHLARSRRVVADEALEESDREGDEGDAGDEDERGDRVDERPDDDEDEEGRGDGADEFADVGLPVFDDAFDGVGEQRDQAPGLLGADSRGPQAEGVLEQGPPYAAGLAAPGGVGLAAEGEPGEADDEDPHHRQDDRGLVKSGADQVRGEDVGDADQGESRGAGADRDEEGLTRDRRVPGGEEGARLRGASPSRRRFAPERAASSASHRCTSVMIFS